MTRDKLTSKAKDKLQSDMDNLFKELTGRINKPKSNWIKYADGVPYKERKKYGQNKFSK